MHAIPSGKKIAENLLRRLALTHHWQITFVNQVINERYGASKLLLQMQGLWPGRFEGVLRTLGNPIGLGYSRTHGAFAV